MQVHADCKTGVNFNGPYPSSQQSMHWNYKSASADRHPHMRIMKEMVQGVVVVYLWLITIPKYKQGGYVVKKIMECATFSEFYIQFLSLLQSPCRNWGNPVTITEFFLTRSRLIV